MLLKLNLRIVLIKWSMILCFTLWLFNYTYILILIITYLGLKNALLQISYLPIAYCIGSSHLLHIVICLIIATLISFIFHIFTTWWKSWSSNDGRILFDLYLVQFLITQNILFFRLLLLLLLKLSLLF